MPISCVRFARYCGKMYSHHFFGMVFFIYFTMTSHFLLTKKEKRIGHSFEKSLGSLSPLGIISRTSLSTEGVAQEGRQSSTLDRGLNAEPSG